MNATELLTARFLARFALVLVLSLGCTGTGCRKARTPGKARTSGSDAEEPAAPLWGYPLASCPCADGTAYIVRTDGQVFWLAKGKAHKVVREDTLSEFFSMDGSEFILADAQGGTYVGGDKHLWYVKAGRASRVEVEPLPKAGEPQPDVTNKTLMWSLWSAYGNTVYQAGYDSGYDDAGWEDRGGWEE